MSTTVVGTPYNTGPGPSYVSGTVQATGITAAVNDVIVVLCSDGGTPTQTCAASVGVVATMTSQKAIACNGGDGKGTIFTGVVSSITTGAVSIAVVSLGGVPAFQCIVLRGLSSATASASLSVAPTTNATPVSGTLNTTGLGTCTFIVDYFNLHADVFTSFLGSPTITQVSHNSGQTDAYGYALDVAAGSYTVGYNTTGATGTFNGLLAIALPTAGSVIVNPLNGRGGGAATPLAA